MKTKNLVRSIMMSITLVIASLLLTLLRVVLMVLIWPMFKVLEKTNNLYQEAMETTCGLLSL